MSKIRCSYEPCGKEFNSPILVTNFSFVPRKETYYACPYCLTKIEDTTKPCICVPIVEQTAVVVEDKKQETCLQQQETETTTINQKEQDKSIPFQDGTFEKIQNLEQEKKDLLAKVTKLRDEATKKIDILETEVADLKKDTEILKKLLA